MEALRDLLKSLVRHRANGLFLRCVAHQAMRQGTGCEWFASSKKDRHTGTQARSLPTRRLMNGRPDPLVGTTPAGIAAHRSIDVGIAGLGRFFEQRAG